MFLKPYKLKSNLPLKSSEAKRFRQRLEKSFPNATPEQLQELVPPKTNLSVLKITTHSTFQTCVFCADKLPLFFEIEDNVLVPTLYAIWKVPGLLPYFTTTPCVLPRLSNGAGLMLPGLVPIGTGMNIYGRYKKGQLVAINLTSNKAAVGIGFLPRSSDDLYMSGGKGLGVKMLHLFGDKLWGLEPSLAQQVPNQVPEKLTDKDFPPLGTITNEKNKPKTLESTETDNVIPSLANNDSEGDVTAVESPELSETETSALQTRNENNELDPDDILKNAFLSALKNHGKSLKLPLLTSNFFRLYVVPESTNPIDLKKTKYKKLSNFLNDMVGEGFIVVREETKGVDKITSIDFDHPTLVNFITDYKHSTAGSTDDTSTDQPLFHSELVEMYIVTDATAAFFTKMDYKRGQSIPSKQIKKIIREYISQNNLPVVDAITKSIKLDETLQAICKSPSATLSQICNDVISNMEHSYQMCSMKDVSSNKPLIQMSLATRSGNKKVTLVSNIECYGIILPEFIKLCKQGAAASTTIVKLPNQKSEQLQIQGNQIRFIYNLLTEKYKVPPKCVLGLELAKDGKKKKK